MTSTLSFIKTYVMSQRGQVQVASKYLHIAFSYLLFYNNSPGLRVKEGFSKPIQSVQSM